MLKRDERAIHLLKVLRKKTGDNFDAGIIGGKIGKGKIEKINPDGSPEFSLDVTEPSPDRLPVRVAVGFPRPIQIRRLLRDLSNLGVEAIDLFGTELGEKSYRDTKLIEDGGARTALIEGAVQSRDTTLPELSVFSSLEKWLQNRPWHSSLRSPVPDPRSPIPIAALPHPHSPLRHCRTPTPHCGIAAPPLPLLIAADNVRPDGTMSGLTAARRPVVVAIGSERGWSDRERGLLEAAGFLRLSLGSRALRTETACVVAAALAIEKLSLE